MHNAQMTRLNVAPMMAWTDRHCRYLHRLCAPSARLFTEMITSAALIHGPRERLLAFNPLEHPLAIQLGGSDPTELARAARLAEAAGFDEINLNVGCPSPRVQQGRFGACLMREGDLVARALEAMQESVSIPVSVKCRLGVDEADSQRSLETFIGQVADSGCRWIYVHARKALLNGISPAQNRQIPPLQYDRVYALKATFPDLLICINGGIEDADAALAHLAHVDAVMIGRKAYHSPLYMNDLEVLLHGARPLEPFGVMAAYVEYMERQLAQGARLQDMTRHCLGLFNCLPGARRYRQTLSDAARLKSNDISLVHEALGHLTARAA